MHIIHPHLFAHTQILLLMFQTGPSSLENFLTNLTGFITGPFGKAATIIGVVFGGVGYTKNANHENLSRVFIGGIVIVAAANIYAWLVAT